ASERLFLFFNSNELCGFVSVHTLQNTFTRWINEHLKCVNKRIVDLQLDLGDGLRLIALLEVLTAWAGWKLAEPRWRRTGGEGGSGWKLTFLVF
uniref:Calponin-homology (CH) domain-containing protein n=1 Tax=Xiphophorus couchianus TaxID=32473 RepID=A0A3B5MQG6_9TELE